MTISLDQFVSREIIYCVSGLVHALSKLEQLGDAYIADDLMSIQVQDDWQSPAFEHIANADLSDPAIVLDLQASHSVLTSNTEDTYAISVEHVVQDLLESIKTEEKAQHYCTFNEIEPQQNEAYEHWIMTDWFATLLEQAGEMVIHDFFGLTIWGRTTTGQAISMDGVIECIFEDLSN